MEVHGPGSLGGPNPISPPNSTQPQASPTPEPPGQPRDEVEISEMGKLLDDLSRTSDIRQERVAEVRRAIEAGEYETPEKLQVAVERLLKDIGEAP